MNADNNPQWIQGRTEKQLDFNIEDWCLIEEFQEDIIIPAHAESKLMSEIRKRYG